MSNAEEIAGIAALKIMSLDRILMVQPASLNPLRIQIEAIITSALTQACESARAGEREKVVAWLRKTADRSEAMNTPPTSYFTGGIHRLRDAADAIERTDHLKAEEQS